MRPLFLVIPRSSPLWGLSAGSTVTIAAMFDFTETLGVGPTQHAWDDIEDIISPQTQAFVFARSF